MQNKILQLKTDHQVELNNKEQELNTFRFIEEQKESVQDRSFINEK